MKRRESVRDLNRRDGNSDSVKEEAIIVSNKEKSNSTKVCFIITLIFCC